MAFLHVAMRGGRRIPAQFTGLSPGCAHSTPARCTSCPQVIHRLCLASGSAGPSVGPHPDEGGRRVAGGCQTLLMCCATRTPLRFREDCCVSIAELDVSSYSGRSDGPDDRVPPQDVHAEQSVLGGMLLSKDAIADVRRGAPGNDFYRPAHETIYDAILDLYGRGEPADADHRLRRADQARRAAAGRRRALPAHADPVGAHRGQRRLLRRDRAERAVLRRLVEAGTRIVQLGYARRRRRRRRHRRQRPGRGLRRHRAAHRRGLPAPRRHHARARSTRSRRIGCRGGADGRRAHRLLRPRRAHQRPAPRPDDRRGRAAGDRQVDAGARHRPVRVDQARHDRPSSSRWR